MRPYRTTDTAAPLPVLRAAVFAVVATVLGLSAHRLAADSSVPWTRAALAALALFGAGLAGTRRPRSFLAVAVLNVAGQAGLHLWLGSGMGSSADMDGMGDPAHSVWHERLPHHSVAMTVAHAVAGVLVAVLMHRADTACWSLSRGFTAAVRPVRVRIATARALLRHRCPARPRPRTMTRADRVLPPPGGGVLADVVVRRGPPAGAVLFAF